MYSCDCDSDFACEDNRVVVSVDILVHPLDRRELVTMDVIMPVPVTVPVPVLFSLSEKDDNFLTFWYARVCDSS